MIHMLVERLYVKLFWWGLLQLLNSFEVERRMVIDCQKKKLKPVKPELISVLIGSMCVETLGRLEKPSDHPALLFPIDYW